MFLGVLASFEQKGMGPTTETTINGPKNHIKYFSYVFRCISGMSFHKRVSASDLKSYFKSIGLLEKKTAFYMFLGVLAEF